MSNQPSWDKTVGSFNELKKVAEAHEIKIPIQAPFTPNQINALMPLLRLPLADDAIQATKGRETGKEYDTTGYSYQAVVDRLNWIFGPTNWTWEIQNEVYELSATKNMFEKHVYSAEISLSIGYKELNPETKQFDWVTVHSVPPIPTDHESLEKGTARKGMLTKGIKRAASFIGVGADAYLGTLDDDLVTGADGNDDMRSKKKADKLIDSDGYIKLIRLSELKGFESEIKLREWYKAISEGAIQNDPANLTKAEVAEIKRELFLLPDVSMKKLVSEDSTEKPSKQVEVSKEEQDAVETETIPTTYAELVSSDESVIRNQAAKYSFKMPDVITDRNKASLCKTLASLMGIK